MNIHRCVFKILGKNQRRGRTHGRTYVRTDNVKTIYTPQTKFAGWGGGGGYNKTNSSETEAPFLDLHLSILDRFISCKIYDKRDDFDFEIVNVPYLGGDVPRRAFYGVYISQLIRFAKVSSHVTDFNTRNKLLTAKRTINSAIS